MTPKALSTKDAAIYLGMSESYLEKARCIGKGTPGPSYYKRGKKVLYKVEDLDRWFEQFRVERGSFDALAENAAQKRGA